MKLDVYQLRSNCGERNRPGRTSGDYCTAGSLRPARLEILQRLAFDRFTTRQSLDTTFQTDRTKQLHNQAAGWNRFGVWILIELTVAVLSTGKSETIDPFNCILDIWNTIKWNDYMRLEAQQFGLGLHFANFAKCNL